jgi:hypothetical protein
LWAPSGAFIRMRWVRVMGSSSSDHCASPNTIVILTKVRTWFVGLGWRTVGRGALGDKALILALSVRLSMMWDLTWFRLTWEGVWGVVLEGALPSATTTPPQTISSS